MIRHIFKIIWNERRVNVWLVLEYILVFCVLWFCMEFLSTTARAYFEPMGYDMKHTYTLQFGEKGENERVELPPEFNNYAQAMLFLERVSAYPAIEAVGLSSNSAPYRLGWSGMGIMMPDSTWINFEQRRVSSGFFDVFRIPLVRGQHLPWPDDSKLNEWIISPDRNGMVGQFHVSELNELPSINGEVYKIAGYTPPLKKVYYEPAGHSVIQTLTTNFMALYNEKTIRVRPEYDHNFPEQFFNDMADQLNIGNYYLLAVIPYAEIAKAVIRSEGQAGKVNSIMAVTAFLMINIFLGILGTFWFRTQSRTSEIGLRMALGASRKRVNMQMLVETILLLTVAAVVGTLICLHIGSTDLLSNLKLPMAESDISGAGKEQYFINFGLTFLFLALVSMVAVWYPSRQAARTQPAEALHDE